MTNVNVEFKSMAAAVRSSGGRKISTGNSKMPGTTFATDPWQCGVGSKMRDVLGSICSSCYAIKLTKIRPSVALGYERNEAELRKVSLWTSAQRAEWVRAMAHQILEHSAKLGTKEHRWFDAGDLASADMLELLVEVARATPNIKHWIPTRELKHVRNWLKGSLANSTNSVRQGVTLNDALPPNMVVRISSTQVDDKPRTGTSRTESVVCNTSTVHKHSEPVGFVCGAYTRGGQCGDCRACWDRDVANVSYPLH